VAFVGAFSFVAPVQAERWKEVRKMVWRKLLVAVVLGLVMMGLVASGVWADTRGRQARPDYVEWGDPDEPAMAHANSAAVASVKGEPGSNLMVSDAGVAQMDRRTNRNATADRPHQRRCDVRIQLLGVHIRR
jgi:hypothetical protein